MDPLDPGKWADEVMRNACVFDNGPSNGLFFHSFYQKIMHAGDLRESR